MAATVQSNFVPEIWSARFTSRLDDELVWGSVANRNYEGDIAGAGDTVHIPTPTTTITVRDYTIDTNIAAAELASGTDQELNIDQQKYFHFYVDDIDRAQARPNIMDDAMGRAARMMAENVDAYISGRVNANYLAARQAATIAHAPDNASWGDDIIKALAKMKRMMTTAKLPLGDRWIIVDEDFMEGLDVHFGTGTAGTSGIYTPATNEQTLRNGFQGMLMGFRLLVANSARVPDGASGKKRAYAGAGMEAVTIATQIVENEAYRPELRFGDAVKGLMVYGSKVVLGARLFNIEYTSAT